jgi:DtxR family Mn-dependent transcriptional regulator
MSEQISLTKSNEDYLEAIYELAGDKNRPVRSVDLADKINVSRPSVSNAVGVLKKKGLVDQEPYGSIVLTEEGFRIGKGTYARHTTLYSFLHDILGVEEATAADEACEIEHTISEDTMNRWRKLVEDNLAK